MIFTGICVLELPELPDFYLLLWISFEGRDYYLITLKWNDDKEVHPNGVQWNDMEG